METTRSSGLTAIGSSDRELFVAAGEHVFVFDAEVTATLQLASDKGITAVTRVDSERLAVGYANGNLELSPATSAGPAKLAVAAHAGPCSRSGVLVATKRVWFSS